MSAGETFTLAVGGITTTVVPSPDKHWRCTRGHEWDASALHVGIRFSKGFFGQETDEDYCWLCLREWCREKVGRVKER